MAPTEIKISDKVTIGDSRPLTVIAGPCQIESAEHCRKMAGIIREIAAKHQVNLIFKASYDKANRTKLGGPRGIGLENGLKILAEISKEFNVPVTTDIHTAEQAELAAEYVDLIQIPAFLCRQTDILIASGRSGKAVNIKKGQFLHPADMQFAVEKVKSGGSQNVMVCERGACFGYRDLIVDYRNFMIFRDLGLQSVFDATHSVQVMGGAGGSSSGNRAYVQDLSLAAISCKVNALFLECHDNPDQAPSDGANMLKPEQLDKLLQKAVALRKIISAN